MSGPPAKRTPSHADHHVCRTGEARGSIDTAPQRHSLTQILNPSLTKSDSIS